jgi:MoaA/NifB/PqqE/SkfB family radical SAM enzyme
MRYALDKNIRLHISTNGIKAKGSMAQSLARCEFVTFSLHTQDGFENALGFLALRRNGKPVTQVSFVRNELTTASICKSLLASVDLSGFDSLRIYEEHSANRADGSLKLSRNSIRTFCPKLKDTLVIAWDGAVSRCNHLWETDQQFTGKSIAEIWRSLEFDLLRQDYPDEKCAACGQWSGHTCGEVFRKVDGKIEHLSYGAVRSESAPYSAM